MPRHGLGHRINPSEINFRANIYGMKKLGVDRIISVSACGSLKKELKPLDFVIPEQFVDRTNQGRKMSFFEKRDCGSYRFCRAGLREAVRLFIHQPGKPAPRFIWAGPT